jgi:hypothetical protein
MAKNTTKAANIVHTFPAATELEEAILFVPPLQHPLIGSVQHSSHHIEL